MSDGAAKLVAFPAGEDRAARRYHVYGRRSSDFAILARDFPIASGNWRKAAHDALAYIKWLRGMGFDQIKTEFHLSEPVDLSGLIERERQP